jgi:hypothetical protein
MLIHKNWVLNIILSVLIIITCIIGDRKLHSARDSHLARAIADNVTHGLIGLFAGAILIVSNFEKFYFAIICMLISSGIDIDHFIIARSLRLTVSCTFLNI